MPKVVARYVGKMDGDRWQRIVAAIERSGAHLEHVERFRSDDVMNNELTVHFSTSEPKDRARLRARAIRLVAALCAAGMTANYTQLSAAPFKDFWR